MSEQEGAADVDDQPAERSAESGTTTCTNCGDVIDESDWFPIRGRTDDDGEFRLFSFCDEECVEAWERI